MKFILFLLCSCSSLFSQEMKIVGYYPNWGIYRTPSFYPKDIKAELVTHINYAFVKVDDKGNLILFDPWADTDYRGDWRVENPYFGNFLQLKELKQKHPHLKTLFSVGGWTLSDTFSAMARTPQTRTHFVHQCIQFCDKYDFDGIDIDWEYPCYKEHAGRPEDKENFTLLLKELFQEAKKHPKKLLVTIAAPAGPHHYHNIEVDKIHLYLDWINLMCYDFAGAGWSDMTNHHAPLFASKEGNPLFNCDTAINYYLSQGVPPSKLVFGMPLYGRSFATTPPTRADGLFSFYKGPGPGTTAEAGMRFFYDIKKNLLSTYKYFWDTTSQVPYLFHPGNGEFITYENETSLAIKCQYLKQKGLGGVMVWELGLDIRPTWDAMTVINKELELR